ncbi:MAG: serine hydrolase [Flavobacteriales bacterium]|nr:serine hydrolase [Flavobacteriales bacterium]
MLRITLILLLNISFVFSQDIYSSLIQSEKKWVDSVYTSLTLEEKVSQLFINWVSPEQSDFNVIRKLVEEDKIGGLIFSIGTTNSHIEWLNKFQTIAKTPLLVAMDAEWGPSQRLTDVFAHPWNMTLGAIQDNSLVRDISKRMAEQNKALGIHYNFSPSVDVNNNSKNPIIGNRSFGEDPNNVYLKAKAYIQGHKDAGVFTSIKHFPGHGDTDKDSHKTLPVINGDIKRLNNVELYPFRRLIEDGIAESIMLAHLSVPALDEKYPSSLSYKTVNNLLRDDYEFNGITITDALDMKGVLQDPNINVDLRAFEVGNDIILMSTNVSQGVKLISESFKKGKISESRLSSSVKKILSLKAKSNLKNFKNISTENILSKVNTSKDTLLYSKAMSSAITLVKNTNNILPLTNNKKYLHVAFGENDRGDHLYDKMNKYLNVDTYTNDDITPLFNKTKYDGILISYHGSSKSPYASNIIPKEIVEKINSISVNNNVVLNLFLNPYSLNSFKSIENFESIVIGYQNNMISQEVLADLLFGVSSFKGKIPVSNNFFKVNHGLTFNKKNIIGFSRPSYEGFDTARLSYLDSIAKNAIDSMMTPGIQMLVSRKGKIVYNKSFGYHTYEKVNKLENNHVFDLSSITKILATMPLVLQEFDNKNISLETNLSELFPKKKLNEKGSISIKEMLSHYARLRPWIPFYEETLNRKEKPKSRFYKSNSKSTFSTRVSENLFLKSNYREKIFKSILDSELRDTLEYKYSDLPFYFLKFWFEDLYNKPLNILANEKIFEPLGLKRTMFNPHESISLEEIVPSERDDFFRHSKLHGHVHDEGAAMLGGISGHAGLFSNAYEVAIVLQAMIQKGSYNNQRLFSENSFNTFNYCYYCDNDNRSGVGFDKPQVEGKHGSTFGGVSMNSFGHYGYTGSIAWADPDEEIIFIFLSNRTYPTRENTLLQTSNIRTRAQEIVYKSLIDSK